MCDFFLDDGGRQPEWQSVQVRVRGLCSQSRLQPGPPSRQPTHTHSHAPVRTTQNNDTHHTGYGPNDGGAAAETPSSLEDVALNVAAPPGTGGAKDQPGNFYTANPNANESDPLRRTSQNGGAPAAAAGKATAASASGVGIFRKFTTTLQSPSTLIRVPQIFFALIAFSVMASVKDFDKLGEFANIVSIHAAQFVYAIIQIVLVATALHDRFPGHVRIASFTFDFMFVIMSFGSACALAARCGDDFITCEDKPKAANAFAFFSSFAFAGSVFFSYKDIFQE
jgi:hypothetical protein